MEQRRDAINETVKKTVGVLLSVGLQVNDGQMDECINNTYLLRGAESFLRS